MSLDDFSKSLEAQVQAEQAREKHFAVRRREWGVLSVLLVLALLAVWNFERAVVTGISMYPTFHDGENLLVWKQVPRSSLKIGDVIVVRHPDGSEIIKRIVFIQNDTGTAVHPATVWTPRGRFSFDRFFSGYFLEVKHGALPPSPPENTIYVMGDNFDHSEDSRMFGPVSPAQVIGKVLQ